MNRPPRPPKENLFAGGLITRILATGVVMAVAVIVTQAWADNKGYDVPTQQTMVFTLLCFVQLGNALSVRSAYHGMFSSGVFENRGMWAAVVGTILLQLAIVYVPFMETVFKTKAIDWAGMQFIIVATVISVLLIEIMKWIMNRKKREELSAKAA